MVLRCPGCSELEFFGRTQTLGELVVCPRCETVFGWRDKSPVKSRNAASAPEDADGTSNRE